MPTHEKWIAFGDIHSEIKRIPEIVELKQAAGVIITGDLTMLGGCDAASKVLESIKAFNNKIFAQIGNMDKPEVTDFLQEQKINLHGEAKVAAPGLTLIGVGGSSVTPFKTPSEFSEEEITGFLEAGLKKAGSYENLVLVSHTPPINTACDRISSGAHVGSIAVRKFVEKYQPALCLCGHIHESRAVDSIGATVIINPGGFSDGGYVIITHGAAGLQAELKSLP